MKAWAVLTLIFAAACSSSGPKYDPPPTREGKEFVDRLTIGGQYRTAPQGSEGFKAFYDLPKGAFVAQGWWPGYWVCCKAWPSCACSPYSRKLPCPHCNAWPCTCHY